MAWNMKEMLEWRAKPILLWFIYLCFCIYFYFAMRFLFEVSTEYSTTDKRSFNRATEQKLDCNEIRNKRELRNGDNKCTLQFLQVWLRMEAERATVLK